MRAGEVRTFMRDEVPGKSIYSSPDTPKIRSTPSRSSAATRISEPFVVVRSPSLARPAYCRPHRFPVPSARSRARIAAAHSILGKERSLDQPRVAEAASALSVIESLRAPFSFFTVAAATETWQFPCCVRTLTFSFSREKPSIKDSRRARYGDLKSLNGKRKHQRRYQV
jgi:hypothetical protein